MTRLLPLLALATTLAGCIIYETDGGWGDDSFRCDGPFCDDDRTGPCGGGDPGDTGEPTGGCTQPPDDTGTDPGTTPPEPDPTPTFSLAPNEACIGDSMLSWVVADDAAYDYANIDRVTFVGDVTVVDTIVRSDEVILLLEVPGDAQPGHAEAIIELVGGGASLAAGGFDLIDCGGGGGGGGGGGTGTGSGTGTGTGTGSGTGTGTGTGTGGCVDEPLDTGMPGC